MFPSCFEIARTHLELPVNRNLGALKKALWDWHRYVSGAPRYHYPAFAAALCIRVERPPPARAPTLQTSPQSERKQDLVQGLLNRKGCTHAPAPGFSASGAGEAAAVPAHRFEWRVPLELWTALLPWEIQHGLSGTPLRVEAKKTSEESKTEKEKEKERLLDDEEEDPYGIVEMPKTNENRAAARDATDCLLRGTLRGLLFVLDAAQTREAGAVRFWSGGIVEPIDVLFFAAARPDAVARSASFRRLRAEKAALRVRTNEAVPSLAERFFPDEELEDEAVTLRLHSHGHLDPFPSKQAHRVRLNENGIDPEEQHETQEDATKEASSNLSRHTLVVELPSSTGVEGLPRYVLEVSRGLLRESVQAALRASTGDFAGGGTIEDFLSCEMEKIELELTLELSPALRANLQAKAQLQLQYVDALDKAVQYHLRRLNTPSGVSAHESTNGRMENEQDEETMLMEQEEKDSVLDPSVERHGANNSSRVQVWFSPHEQRWMRPKALAALRAARTRDSMETPHEAEARHEAAAVKRQEEEVASNWKSTGGGPAPQRFLARYSPRLANEDGARPAVLAPGFHGRHDALVHRRQGVASADRLARYPACQPTLPVLAPIDYELFELCIRLGVGQPLVVLLYYERLLREWRTELHRLHVQHASPKEQEINSVSGNERVDEAVHAEAKRGGLDEDAMQRMLRLVRDPSLDVPDELRELVEAVHQHRCGNGHGSDAM